MNQFFPKQMMPEVTDQATGVSDGNSGPCGRESFTQTHWTQVMLAARMDGSPEARAALEALCARYWPSIYGFLRRQGHSPADAEDVTQGFFAKLLDPNALSCADRAKGRFRSFLLGALRRFLTDRHRHNAAAKRGPGKEVLALDFAEAERAYLEETDPEQTPEEAFDRRWAATVLAGAMDDLEAELRAAGQGARFEELVRFLSATGSEAEYAAVAGRLGLAVEAVPTAVFRLRERYRESVRLRVLATVAGPEEVSAEFRELFRAAPGALR